MLRKNTTTQTATSELDAPRHNKTQQRTTSQQYATKNHLTIGGTKYYITLANDNKEPPCKWQQILQQPPRKQEPPCKIQKRKTLQQEPPHKRQHRTTSQMTTETNSRQKVIEHKWKNEMQMHLVITYKTFFGRTTVWPKKCFKKCFDQTFVCPIFFFCRINVLA